MRRLFALLAIAALVSFGLVACGGDDEGDEPAATTTEETTETGGGGGGGGDVVQLEADPGGALEYAQDKLEANAGPVTIEFTNPASLGHDVCVEDSGGELGCSDVITASSTTLDLELDPGDYTYFCSVAGHREAGMEGTLTAE